MQTIMNKYLTQAFRYIAIWGQSVLLYLNVITINSFSSIIFVMVLLASSIEKFKAKHKLPLYNNLTKLLLQNTCVQFKYFLFLRVHYLQCNNPKTLPISRNTYYIQICRKVPTYIANYDKILVKKSNKKLDFMLKKLNKKK